jgi:hypothetical protein
MHDSTNPGQFESDDEITVIEAGRRLGVRRSVSLSDWYTSWSPRNDNSNAEGPWSEWVELAREILAHPLTATLGPVSGRQPQPDACNCQSTDGDGPWHPMGDTPSCPQGGQLQGGEPRG